GFFQIPALFRDVFGIDTKNPAVTGLTPSTVTVADATAGSGTFTLTVGYSEAMDPAVAPVLSFPGQDLSSTLTFASGRWLDALTYLATYDVADAGVEVPAVAVRVGGARDAAGNL